MLARFSRRKTVEPKTHIVDGNLKPSLRVEVKPIEVSDSSSVSNLSSRSEGSDDSRHDFHAYTNGHNVDLDRPIDTHFTTNHMDVHQSTTEMLDTPKSHVQPPIAICGMALRAPAGVKTPQQLWDFLIAGGDARSQVPASRYNVAAFHDPTGKPGTVITEYGYFIDEDIGALDTSFFSMPRMEVERTDPQQRMMLEAVRECFEDAGETSWKGKPIGCYMGCLGEDWCEMFARETQNFGPYRFSGYGDWALSNRVSYEMDLQGPSITLRTACSASLVALHSACTAISRGDCNSAIVGGANLIMSPGVTMSMTEQNVLSKDGSCKTFSADANGYARGEAIAAIFIKRLDDAIRDGNSIRGVIKGTMSNSDGKTPGMTVPSSKAQETLMRKAYEVAGITDFTKTAFVECHGTGTPMGDPVETKAVAKVFGNPNGMHITSIKPNFGHTEGASGILSVIKAVLALENKMIPPQIKFSSPNPKIPFDEAKLIVPLKPTPWPLDRLERVSVNSFGIGGANAHVIIDSATSCRPSVPRQYTPLSPTTDSEEPQLLLFSANSQTALTKVIENHRNLVEARPNCASDLAYTLANKREHLPHRAFGIASHGKLENISPVNKPSSAPSVVMVFTGQGAQWPQMGRELLDGHPVFQQSIQRLDQYLQDLDELTPEWNIERELRKIPKRSQVNKAQYSQPLCTAIQIALVDVLAELGVKPDAVVGHSSGEIAAAYAAGALTAQEAITIALYRGNVADMQKRPGAMAAIGMSWEETFKYLKPNTTIACDNSPKSVTISGDIAAVDAVLETIQSAHSGVLARKLQVEKAYHSYHMSEVGSHYLSLLRGKVSAAFPATPFFSSVTGELLGEETDLGPSYWQRNLESPVLFRSAVSSILKHPVGKNAMFLELGPHSALAGPLRQILAQDQHQSPYASVLIRNQNCTESLLSAIGKLFTLQVPVKFEVMFPSGKCLSDLPRYPYDHSESYWYESRLSKEWRHRKYAHHDLLGVRLVETTDFEPVWRNMFHLNTAPWVRDHKVGEDIVFPFAGYVAMAGEAIRQLTGIDETFRLRHVIASTALVVQESKPTELVTTLRPHRLTDTLDSKWWEFAVYSHNGHAWTKHCVGQVMAQTEDLGTAKPLQALPRKVEMRKWFDMLRSNGLDLGPAFYNLGPITAGTRTQESVAELLNDRHTEPEKYHIHPTVIDSALQLMGVAFTNGQARKFKNRLPTGCDEFSISRTAANFIVGVSSKSIASSAVADACGTQNGTVVLRISNLKLSAVDNRDMTGMQDTHATARLEWGPDIDFMNIADLVHETDLYGDYSATLQRLLRLCLTQMRYCIAGSTSSKPYLECYKRWIETEFTAMYQSFPTTISHEQTSEKINQLVQDLSTTSVSHIAMAMRSISENANALHSGEIPSWENVVPNGTVTGVYDLLDDSNLEAFVQASAHSKPNLRVLEIGSWSSTPNKVILNNLLLPNGNARCAKYTFASKQFIAAQDKLSDFLFLDYATLDIGEDPLAQGFESGQYDIIISSNALCPSRDVGVSLQNIKKLLHPDGRLVLREFDPLAKQFSFILGTTSRWWSGAEANGLKESCLNVRQWKQELKQTSFGTIEAVFQSHEKHANNVLIIKCCPDPAVPKRISLLCSESTAIHRPLLSELQWQGYKVNLCTIYDEPTPNQDIIAMLDVETPFFENIDSATYEAFRNFIQEVGDSRVLWITRPSQVDCQDPRFAQSIGVARTMRSEMLIDFGTCEVDSVEQSIGEIVQVFMKFQKRETDELLKPDLEYSIRNNIVNIGRFYPFALSDDLRISESGDRAKLDIAVPGRPSTLHWVKAPALTTLNHDQVEVEIHVVGLNFRDVLVAMNVVQFAQGRVFGCEGAGIVRRVGSNVKSLKEGDRVALIRDDMFATTVITLETLCVKIPDTLGFNEAATMFVPYTTALYSMMNVGGLEKGMSILIHSACGGVGLAAIQLARIVEADIYVTVGSEEKFQYLMNAFDIPRNHIFNSRNDSFVGDLMRETNNAGVDLVLNSLSGELLHATWKCVAPFGKLIEIGKRDLLGNGKLEMSVFLANRSYCCVDLDALCIKRPAMGGRLLRTIVDHLENGRITPITPVKVFDGASPYDAFRYMQPGTHVGRICLTLRNNEGVSTVEPVSATRLRTLTLNDSASYLLIGGLGGLGRAISTWMVEQGARHLIYLSRTAGARTEDQLIVQELKSMGCEVQLIQGSVTSFADVSKAIKEAQKPVRGILQMSMVLRDRNFSQMTFEDWDAAVQPKVQGTWNLHNATANLDLDFFVLFSSLSGVIGQPGQTNYAGANTFLDAFVQYRNNLGLPATTIDIGAVGEVGYIAHNRELMQKMAATGFKSLKEQEVLDALTAAMTRKVNSSVNIGSHYVDQNNFVLGLESSIPLNAPTNRAVWRKDRRMAIYHNTSSESADTASSGASLKSYIASAKADTSILQTTECGQFLATEIGKKLFALLLRSDEDLNISLSLTDLGMDSLVAIELRTWWKQAFGFDISVLEMLGMGTLEALGQRAAEGLLQAVSDARGGDA